MFVKSLLGLVISIVACITMLDQTHAQVLLNGSLTGTVSDDLAPPDWFKWQKTPDTVDSAGPFNNTGVPWTLSPDGGTFVRGGGSTFDNSEAIAQDVSGFTIGGTYSVSFFQTNLGFEHPTSGDWIGEDGYWELLINGSSVGTSTTLSRQSVATDPTVWFFDSLTFVAPTTDVEIAFVSRSVHPSGLAAYMGIDGIQLRQTAVPEPGVATFMFAALGLVCIRRQRNRNRI